MAIFGNQFCPGSLFCPNLIVLEWLGRYPHLHLACKTPKHAVRNTRYLIAGSLIDHVSVGPRTFGVDPIRPVPDVEMVVAQKADKCSMELSGPKSDDRFRLRAFQLLATRQCTHWGD
jgi:hypothetical protein